MSGKSLYDKHCTALKNTEDWGYKNGEYVRRWPTTVPPAWQFAPRAMRTYYTELARLLTPKPRKEKP